MPLRLVTDRIQPVIFHEGKRYLQFAGTSYLGMGNLPEFLELIKEGIEMHGYSHGSSRYSNLQLGIYDAFEDFLAQNAGAEQACVVSSGTLAGRIALEVMAAGVDLWWVAPDAHPAIRPHGKVSDLRQSFGEWAETCLRRAEGLMGQRIGILANTVNPLHPQVNDFSWMERLPAVNEYRVLLDDSHAFGLVGKGCFGTYSRWKNLPVHLMICGSLGKALCIPAGIILGQTPHIQEVRESVFFRSSSPPSPAGLHALMAGNELYHTQKMRLQELMSQVIPRIEPLRSFAVDRQVPVLAFQNEEWVKILFNKGILVSSFPYPQPHDPCVDRIVISAGHEDEDVSYLINCLETLS